MKAKLVNFIKNNRLIYSITIFFYRCFYNFIGLFCKTKKQIIFTSFGGRKFDDSPFALYQQIISDDYFNDFEIIWAFSNPNSYQLPRGKAIKIDTFKFFVSLMKSKIWISNTSIDRGIGLHKKSVIRVETWHGTPLKKICGEENNLTFKPKKNRKIDNKTIRCAQSEYDQEIFARVFNASKECIHICDLPRNDELAKEITLEEKNELLEKIGVPKNKKIILYMPTYREYLLDKKFNNYIVPPINLNIWKEKLSNEYVLLFRAHYAVNKVLGIKTDDFVIDVSNFPHLNSLFLISDILISDYSSAFFDFSITGKPMICFAYDLKEYCEKRGLYLDIKKDMFIDVFENENDLITNFKNISNNSYNFKQKYAPNPGNASAKLVLEIKKKLQTL